MNDPLGVIRAVIGGNQACHCVHVKELIERVGKLEALPRAAAANFTPDPWSRSAGHTAPVPVNGLPAGSAQQTWNELPLKLTATLGSIGYRDRPIFDQKMALQDDFKFNGVKDGHKWKNKGHGYFMTCAPVLMGVFRLAGGRVL